MGQSPLNFSLLFMLLALPALANDEGMTYSESVEAPPSSSEGIPPMSVPVSEDARDAFENPRLPSQDPVKKGAPPRFDLENRARFRQWIHELCKLEAVSPEESGRALMDGARKAIFTAKNKQGSLQLLLENYVDDVKFEQNCELKRKSNPAACTDASRINDRKYSGALDNLRGFRNAKKSADLLKQVKEKRLARQNVLKTEFFDLRDAGSLDGKTTEKAERILQALKEDSSCRTRSVQSNAVHGLAQK